MTYSFGQIAQLVKKFTEVGVTPEALSRLGQAKKKQLDVIDAYLTGRATLTRASFLNSAGSITLPAIKKPPILVAGDGVFLWDGAKALFQNIESSPLPKMRVAYDDLTERRNDFQNIEEIGDKSIFDVEELSPQLARLLKKQVGGKKGALLNDGKANIFYVRDPKNPEQVLYVGVYWDGGAQEWRVFVYPAAADAWRVGIRVFRKCGSLAT